MREFRRFTVLALVFSSFFMTGCDVSKILDVITKIAEGVAKVAPVIKDAINGITTANTNTATTTTTNTASNTANVETTTGTGNVTISNATDKEDLTNGTTTTTTSTSTSAAEAALANYKGGKLSPSEFGKLFGPVAKEISKKYGVPASIILAQAALETGWGGSTIGDAKNLFGIKGTGPAGSISVPTKEVVNGKTVTVQASFRKYNTWEESILDHSKLLLNSRYANAMKCKNDPDQFAKELQKAGYATDPSYASKLISIMKSNNFYQYNN